jgi:formate-dependent phosphoribosylglycinamide formyltransferase (GAR transformylase)
MEGRVLTLDLQHPSESAERAATFAERWPVDAVVGVDEASVLTAASIAERLGSPVRNPVPSVAATRDKRLLRERLAARGLSQPRWVSLDVDADDDDIDTAIEVVGLPCVVKPVDLAASRGVIRADDPTAAHAAVRRVGALLREICTDDAVSPMLVESYVDGVEVALEGLVRQGFLDVIALFDKPDPLVGPFFEETIYVTPSRLDHAAQTAVSDAARGAVSALGLMHGPVHVEIRMAGSTPVVIEVAARSIGGLCSQIIRVSADDAPGEMRSLENVILREACGLPLGAMHMVDPACGVFMLPIPTAGILRGVDGLHRAESVRGITGVTISVPIGEPVQPLPEGDRYLGFVFARGDTSEGVEASLRTAQELLEIDIASA